MIIRTILYFEYYFNVVSGDDVYGGTYRYFAQVAPKIGLEVDFVDLRKIENLIKYIKPNTKVRILGHSRALHRALACLKYVKADSGDGTLNTPNPNGSLKLNHFAPGYHRSDHLDNRVLIDSFSRSHSDQLRLCEQASSL